MRLARNLLFLLATAVAAAPLAAQEVATEPSLVPGQRARVTYHRLHRRIIGEVVSYDEHELVFRKSGDPDLHYITWDKVALVEASIHQYTRRETIKRGIISGILLGVAIGTSAIVYNEVVGSGAERTRKDVRIAAAVGLGITTLAGGFLGTTWPRDSWQRVPLHGNPPRLTVRPLPDARVGLGLSFAGFEPASR